jgi:hypothetical protein
MKRRTITFGLVLALMVCAPAQADIYRWKDANGVTHFSNEPPPPGATVLETIEEAPYDAEADRRRLEDERRLRLERQNLELEERKAGLAVREREAQMRLDEAERRMNEARSVQSKPQESTEDDDCDQDDYLRYGSCGYSVYGPRYYQGRPGQPNLYRGYYRENNNLYYRAPHRPGPPPGPPPGPQPPPRPGGKPAPKPDGGPNAAKGKRPPAAAEDPSLKGPPAPQTPAASK